MKVSLRRFAFPLVAIVALWFVAVVLFGLLAEAVLGSWESGRVFPFSNAHLLEEAMEGIYAPLQDPAFLLYSVAVALAAFGLSGYWGARGAPRSQLPLVCVAALVGIVLFAFHLRSAFSSGAPAPIRSAAIFALAVSVLAAGIGIAASRYRRARHG